MSIVAPALRFGEPVPFDEGLAELRHRVETVLTTRTGSLPWLPRFGCDIAAFQGRPATNATLNDLRWRVQEALAAWLRDVAVESLHLELVPVAGPGPARFEVGASVPPDAALLALGTEVDIVVQLAVRTRDGVAEISVGLGL